MSRRFLALTLLAAGLGLAAAPPASAQVTMRLASATINDVQHEWQKVFAEELAERVGDQVKVEIYPASQLGSIPRMVEGVLFGTIESFVTPTSFLVGTDPRFQVFDAPALFEDGEHAGRTLHHADYRDHIETFALDKGVRIIGAIYNSPMLLLANRPVETLGDFGGLKVRTFSSPLQMQPLSALGSSPVPLSLNEVVPAMQSGAIDGLLAGMPILTAFQYWDVAEYVTDLNFAIVVSVSVVNEAWLQAQPEEIRTAILEAGRAAEQAVLPWGIENVARANRVWEENGGRILALSAEEQAEMEARFAEIAAGIFESEQLSAEYERLLAVVQETR